MPSTTCGSCNRKYDFDASDFQPLSSVEMAICVKEGLDIEKTVKIVCPFCDTAMLVKADRSASPSSSQTLSMAGRDYAIFTSTHDMGVSAGQDRRCGYKTTFARVVDNITEVGKASGASLDPRTQFMVKCAHCQTSLSESGLSILIMAQMYGKVAATGAQTQALLAGHCPKCGKQDCYCLFDPSGFEGVRSASVPASMPTAQPKKKGFWPFRK